MNSKILRKIVSCVLPAILVCSLAACSTTAGTNAKDYFKNTSDVLKLLFASGDENNASELVKTASGVEQLAAPGNFTVGADGNYAFTGVENAEYYLIYLCAPDAVNDDDSYIYCSQPIGGVDTNEYEGKLADLLQYAFGEYLVKVLAFPDLTSSSYEMSKPASVSYTYSGNQNAPELSYYWNTFDNTMSVQVTNLSVYQYQAYPDVVEVTFTNTSDSADTVTELIESVSATNFSVVTDKLKRGQSYTITAVAKSSSQFVLNPTSDTTIVSEGLTVGDASILVGNYSYSDGFANNIFCYPRACSSFNLAGGSAGTITSGFGGSVDFSCTPIATSAGSAYSYTVSVNSMMTLVGSMELKTDGTFTMSLPGAGPLEQSTTSGIWKDNGDGTATLSYDPSNVVIG